MLSVFLSSEEGDCSSYYSLPVLLILDIYFYTQVSISIGSVPLFSA